MSNSLIIVESPTKARTISKFLGSGYEIRSSNGHVRDLPKKTLGVNIDNDFQPEYEVIPQRKKTISELKKASLGAKGVYLATDPDREGEAIAWHIAQLLNLSKAWRIEFHEITKPAVLKALSNSRSINLNLVNAQQARRILDRLVGYKISPLLWQKVKRGLSAGRVQSVALRLICEREKEVEEFVPQEYWEIWATLSKDEEQFKAKLIKVKEEKVKINNQEESETILHGLEGASYVVEEVKIKEQKRKPLPPFITSTLQQEANYRLGFSASKSMLIAQSLYEGVELGEEGPTGLITYMRTDSVNLSNSAKDEAKRYIQEKYGKEYLPKVPRLYKSRKGAQEAHEAIRPVLVYKEPEGIKKYLSSDQFRLYQLIFSRFLASQMSDALLEVVSVDIRAGKEYLFRATGSRVLFPGFRKVYKEKEEEERKTLPKLKEKELLRLEELTPEQHFTSPPPRYTEATLVKTLEEEGIGRPSTYAPIIKTVQERDYVKKEKRTLLPTNLGKVVNELLVKNFTQIMEVKFTAQMEDNLDKIEEGKSDWVEILNDFYQGFSQVLKIAKREMARVKIEPEKSDVICEKCGRNMVIREGRFGKFLACSGFPECKNTKPLIKPTGIKCPKEGCEGEVIERRSKKGKIFYGCSRYPECDFISKWKPKDVGKTTVGSVKMKDKNAK